VADTDCCLVGAHTQKTMQQLSLHSNLLLQQARLLVVQLSPADATGSHTVLSSCRSSLLA
jgi:hypothetical protein